MKNLTSLRPLLIILAGLNIGCNDSKSDAADFALVRVGEYTFLVDSDMLNDYKNGDHGFIVVKVPMMESTRSTPEYRSSSRQHILVTVDLRNNRKTRTESFIEGRWPTYTSPADKTKTGWPDSPEMPIAEYSWAYAGGNEQRETWIVFGAIGGNDWFSFQELGGQSAYIRGNFLLDNRLEVYYQLPKVDRKLYPEINSYVKRTVIKFYRKGE